MIGLGRAIAALAFACTMFCAARASAEPLTPAAQVAAMGRGMLGIAIVEFRKTE